MRRFFTFLIVSAVLAGCSKASVEPELTPVSNATKIALLEAVADCSAVFGPWTLPGTGFTTMQVCLTRTLPSPVTIHFEARPRFNNGTIGDKIRIDPVTLSPGVRYIEVKLLPFVLEVASSCQINIDYIDYNGPGSVLKDNSKWSVKPHPFDFETYGFEITRVTGI